jgi:hypothetical protein
LICERNDDVMASCGDVWALSQTEAGKHLGWALPSVMGQ